MPIFVMQLQLTTLSILVIACDNIIISGTINALDLVQADRRINTLLHTTHHVLLLFAFYPLSHLPAYHTSNHTANAVVENVIKLKEPSTCDKLKKLNY